MPDDISAILRRLDMNERNQSDFAKSLTEIIGDLHEIRAPLDDLKMDREVRKERDKHLSERLSRIEKSIERVYSLGLWVLGAFGLTLIAAISNFLIRGGLNGGP